MTNRTFDEKTSQTISEAAERAASQVVSLERRRDYSFRNIPERDDPIRSNLGGVAYGKAFASEMVSLDKKAKETLAKIYLNRQKDISEPEWKEIYSEWLTNAPASMRDQQVYSPNKLKALAKRYFEKIASGSPDEKKSFDPTNTIRREIEEYRLSQAGVKTKW